MRRIVRRLAAAAALLTCVALWTVPVPRDVVHAQEEPPGPVAGSLTRFAVSAPVSEIAAAEGQQKFDPATVAKVSTVPIHKLPFEDTLDFSAPSGDDAVQDSHPVIHLIPEPAVSSDGLGNADNAAVFGFRVSPPDTVGDVGPNHYVQMVNLLVRVFNKSGVPLTLPFKLSSLFTSLGGACVANDNGDPIVLYDPLADRWLLSQFCTVANPYSHQMIAISKTGDPTGAYYLYDFMMPNEKFNDYPHFGVWPDAYYMTDNQFNQAGTAFQGGGVFAFDRVKMLAGDPTAGFIYFDLATNKGGMLPADLDGLNPPPAGAPGYFAQYLANELSGDGPIDAMRIFEFHADFANPSASTFTQRADSPVPVAAFDPRNPSGRADIEQPPPALSTHSLDSIQDRLMFRLQYRNFGSHESLVTTHTVNVSGVTPSTQATHRAGVRYYELRRSLPGGSFSVPEQATFAPDTDNRWMGSAAMDHEGNLAVGYSVSSLTTFPSIRYAGRLATDPPNGLAQGETTLVAGTGVQRSTGSRWGDYSALTVDPADDCTFWYTTEYYTAASQASSTVGWLTRIGSFKFPSCTLAERGTVQGVVTNAVTGTPIPGALVQTATGHLRSTDLFGVYSLAASPGTYQLTASKPGFQSASASIVITNGGTTVQDFALTPIPVLVSSGSATLESESCGPATGGIDPGETVTVALSIKNTGAADTASLVATLLPTGGVTSPGPAQSYGVVAAGGAPVTRSFTFVADPGLACGSALTATLSLQDGVTALGTVSYAFTVGTLSNGVSSATVSTGDIAVAIPDVSTVEIPITVADIGSITDVNVKFRLNHTFDGDLVISLVHPDGTVVTLSSNRGGNGDNFGTGANDCSGTPTVFDDSAATAIGSGVAPFAGAFRPDQPLAVLNGKPSNGVWKLRIADTGPLDVGTVGCVQLQVNRRQFLCCPYSAGTPVVQAAPPAVVTAESVSPFNHAPDPDETVTVNFPLLNVGDGLTTNLVATLLPGDGVNTPSGPQDYGVVSPVGPAVARPFTFVAGGACRGIVTATLQLNDGPIDLGTVTFNLTLGAPVTTPALSENFDGVAAPAIPAGWSATLVGTTPPPAWATTTTAGFFVSAPNGAATGSSAAVSESRLTSPPAAVPAGDLARLTFRNNYSLETGFDGGVLEISINGGAFVDVITAGGSFVSGGYNRSISTAFQSPIAGRMAWSGTGASGSNGFITTTVNLPPSALGQSVSLRWRAAFDNAVSPAGAGWRIDDVSLTTTTLVCNVEPCALTCPADVARSNDADQCDAQVSFASPALSGSCGVLACAPASGSVFPVGLTSDTCTATRISDGGTTSCSFNVAVSDAQAPAISAAAASPSSLWPANHRLVDVTVTYGVAENCGAFTISLGVSSNEPANGGGDGNTAPDWEVVDAHHVRLRAERSGGGNGRVYTITITTTDGHGNSSSQAVLVRVPHDQGT